MSERHHLEEIADMTHEEVADALLYQINANKDSASGLNYGLTRMGALYRRWAETDPADRMNHNAIDSMRIDFARIARDLRDQPDLFIDSWPSKHHGTA